MSKTNYNLILNSVKQHLNESNILKEELEKKCAKSCIDYLTAVQLPSVTLDYEARIRESVILLDKQANSVLLQYHSHIYSFIPAEKEIIEKLLQEKGIIVPEKPSIIDVNGRLMPDEATLSLEEDKQQDNLYYFITYLYSSDKPLADAIKGQNLEWFSLNGIEGLFEKDIRFDSWAKRLVEKVKSL